MTTKIEKQLESKILYSIKINDGENVDKFYDEYLKYTRQILKGNFNQKIQNKLMYAYAEHIKKRG